MMILPHEEYLETIKRIEPDIHMIDPGAFYASTAISMKRIADALEILATDKIRDMARKDEGWPHR
jgi:hypothetical protein